MNIEEIATLAGVSTATVSRVMNESPKVRPATAQRVKRVIEKSHYVPNTSARSLRVGRTRLFALIVSDIKNPYFPELIDRFEAMAAQHGSDVIFTHTNYNPAHLEHCVRRMVERNVDGIALMTSEMEPEALHVLRRTNIPVVLLNASKLVAEGWNNVAVDYKTGFQQAIDHLHMLGHRNIGFIAGPPDIGSAMRRFAAFRDALEINDLKFMSKWSVAGDFHVEGGFSAMAELLGQVSPPTAVIASNDLMAIGAMHAVHAKGLSVPGDVSIIGFDNIDVCTMSNPPLSSIGVSREAIATHAFEMLHNSVISIHKPRSATRTVSTSLVIRKSTGKLKA